MKVRVWTWAMVLMLGLGAGPVYGQLSSDDIAVLRARGEVEGWTFTVRESEATRRPLHELCGAVEPPDWRSQGRADPCLPGRDLPEAFDWRDYYGCTPVRNQGGCGSCWAFAAIGAVESGILINQEIAEDLSEQWLVSCTGAGSCSGGWHTAAFEYIRRNGERDLCGDFGAVLESDFPYVGYDADCMCPYPHPYSINSWAYVSSPGAIPTPNQIKQAMLDHGPVAVSVYVNSAFSAYGGGVFNACEDQPLNHSVVLVGWDDNQGAHGVWIMRNSWGPWWGEEGYMRITYGCSGIGYAAAYVDYPQDCNNNGQFDYCDLDCQAGDCVWPCGQSSDCNLNSVPDECEPDEDCNANGAQDICDVADGTSEDCNWDDVPDECEPDCDTSGVPDDCEVYEDCNDNGVQDICDIAAGTSVDCNENRRPDECDLAGFTSASGELSPIGNGSPQHHTILSAPQAFGEVRLSFTAIADLNLTLDEWVDVDVNGIDVGRVFRVGYDCPSVPNTDELLVPPATFNAAVNGGNAVINMITSNAVDPGQCVPYSFITVSVEYETALDCNDNGVPDDCEPDCNGNGVADSCDISNGTSLDEFPSGGDGIPDECQSDCNENGVPDDLDIVQGTSEDCQPNEVPDECDLSGGESEDCDGNTIPDECQADCDEDGIPDVCELPPFGDSDDCNFNGVPDECEPDEDCNGNGVRDICDIGAGTSHDCQPNSIPDECDVADGSSENCDGDGTPDECEVDADGDGFIDDCDNCPMLSNGDQADRDRDSVGDVCDPCPDDLLDDRDGDGVCDSDEECFTDPNKLDAGECGCGVPDTDGDGDEVADCNDLCPGVDDAIFGSGCAEGIPTVSHWGLLIMGLLLLTAGKLRYGGHTEIQNGG